MAYTSFRKILVTASAESIASFTTALHAAIDEAAREAKEPVDRISEIAHEVSDKALDAGNDAVGWVDKRAEWLAGHSKNLIGCASAYVSAHPLKAVGIAALAAVVIGRLTR